MSEAEGAVHGSRPLSFAIDEIARAARSAPRPDAPAAPKLCDACDEPIEGEPGGSGLYVWTRGAEVRLEEPPLCESCATAIGITALARWAAEDDEEE